MRDIIPKLNLTQYPAIEAFLNAENLDVMAECFTKIEILTFRDKVDGKEEWISVSDICAYYGKTQQLEFCLRHQKGCSYVGVIADIATSQGHMAIVKRVLEIESGSEDFSLFAYARLLHATRGGSMPLLRLLLDTFHVEFDVKQLKEALGNAAYLGHMAIFNRLLEIPSVKTNQVSFLLAIEGSIMDAAERQYFNIVDRYIDVLGSCVDSLSHLDFIFSTACSYGSVTTVKRLIDLGYQPVAGRETTSLVSAAAHSGTHALTLLNLLLAQPWFSEDELARHHRIYKRLLSTVTAMPTEATPSSSNEPERCSSPRLVEPLKPYQRKLQAVLDELIPKLTSLSHQGFKGHPTYSQRYEKIGLYAQILKNQLIQYSETFFNDPTPANYQRFKQQSLAIIEQVEDTFKEHRGIFLKLHPLIKALVGVIAFLSVVPAALVAHYSPHGALQTFFGKPNTDAYEKLLAMKAALLPKVSFDTSSQDRPIIDNALTVC